MIGNALKNLGKAVRVLGDIPRGAAAYREAVTLVAEHGDREQVTECLEGLAHLATVGGAPERAARLFGAAEALYETTGVQMPVFDPNAYEPTLAAIRTAVDETTVAEGEATESRCRSSRLSPRRRTWRIAWQATRTDVRHLNRDSWRSQSPPQISRRRQSAPTGYCPDHGTPGCTDRRRRRDR